MSNLLCLKHCFCCRLALLLKMQILPGCYFVFLLARFLIRLTHILREQSRLRCFFCLQPRQCFSRCFLGKEIYSMSVWHHCSKTNHISNWRFYFLKWLPSFGSNSLRWALFNLKLIAYYFVSLLSFHSFIWLPCWSRIVNYYFADCCFCLQKFKFCLFHCIHFRFYFDCFAQLWNWIGYCYRIIGTRSSAVASCFKPLVWCSQLCYCPIKRMPICKPHFRSTLRQLSFACSLRHFYSAEIHNYHFEIYLHC